MDGIWQAPDAMNWPQIDGIPYLRAGREAMASEAAGLLRTGRRTEALALLLTDVDDFAAAAPDIDAAMAVVAGVAQGRLAALEAMRQLAYGPVADYFAIRPSTPTFISGLELLAQHVDDTRTVVEPACGTGHFLSHLSRHGVSCAGCDVTFSKLWLGRRFLLGNQVPLACADIVGGAAFALTASRALSVFCHDAFYFLPDKPAAASRLESLAGARGQVLLGHVHLDGYDHAGIAGDLLSAEDYGALFRTVTHVYDDAELIGAWRDRSAAVPVAPSALAGREAMALAAGHTSLSGFPANLRFDPPAELLYANPLLDADASGYLQPAWPSDAFALEYRDAHYLGKARPPEPGALPRHAETLSDEQHTQRVALPAQFVALATEPLRWGVVGCGWVARDYVLPAFAQAPSAQLVALCDSDADKLASCLAGGSTAAARHTDFAAMLRNEGLDALYVATPNDSHAALCIAAVEAGCDVMCEKPMAATMADARAMTAAFGSGQHGYATAFDQRFHEAHHVLRTAVRQGRLGTITQARVHYACQVDPDWRASVDDTDNWRLDRERAGGGAVIDLAPHALDLLAHVLDDEPCAVDMRLQARLPGTADRTARSPAGTGSIDAGGVLSVAFSRGALASIHVSYQTPEFLPRRDIELIGTSGGAHGLNTMGQTPGGQIEWRLPNSVITQSFATDAGLSPFARQIEAFSACRRKKQAWPFSAERDLAHFELLLDAMSRAEATLFTTSGPH